jgi:hypothetical protein
MLRFSMPSSCPQCTPEPNAFGTAVKSKNQVDPPLAEPVWTESLSPFAASAIMREREP